MGGIVHTLHLLLESGKNSRKAGHKRKLGPPKMHDEKKNEQMQILLSFRQLIFSCPESG